MNNSFPKTRDYRMVLHSGTMEGHYSQFNLLPDMELGVYTSRNGQDGGSQEVRELIFMYIGEY